MERESFEDLEVARLMNEHLVAVKVDREEVPAVDHLFMAFCQGMTGSGGWPLTVVLTPTGKPFFAGTYFPKASGFGRPGMIDLARLYDARWGGFGSAPKFPTVPWLFFLLRYSERHGGDGRARVMVEETLRAMRLGGIFDQIGFGFHRYSTDAGWLVPHFEKMLYDQALLALAYTEAYRLWGDGAFRSTAEEIFSYVLRDLKAPDGGFAAAEDADSEGEEGRFYLWSVDEVTALLGPAAAEEFTAAFQMTANGATRCSRTGTG